ncbi:hypothetical protein BWQ96_04200 [Gracilariopsis chorda]|uniref:Uncharacterized protein n=1 Tax=Gracilariopsis chorda TaxID=448386 RepID=A0A2V3IVA9_9FLOR|nr:hypothetical protein BWQ96_04200 [Gracilariopsis chorda]|eukprot:PXF46025.1 hypothetical protein BWQ96_04200 [Gracilariopsis chorda]
MQPISSDSELDLNPAPPFLPRLYLQSEDVRNAYDAFQDDVTPPLSRSASPCASESELPSEPRESDPTRMIPPQTQSLDIAPPSDEQLGLPSALSVAIDQIPPPSRLLTLAMYQAPCLALVSRFPRTKVATAVAHTLNMRRALGGARAVLLVARTAATARQWQQQLSISLDEVRVTVFRTARAARDATLNSLRTEQFPGVIIVSDRVLRNIQLWNGMCAALKQNRVVPRWQLVVSEIRGNDAALNLYHSPFRMVADQQADAGLMVMCSDDVARARKEQVSKEAVNSFVRSQLPSMSSTNPDAMWLTPESILLTKNTKEAIVSPTKSPISNAPESNSAHETISPMRDVDNKARRKPRRRSKDQTRAQQRDQQPPPNRTRTQRPSIRLMPRTASVPQYTRQTQEDVKMTDASQLQKEQANLNSRTTRTNTEALNSIQSQEEGVKRRLRSNLRSNRQNTSKRSPVPQNHSVLCRSSSRDRVSVRSLDRRSFSIIDVSDDSDSADEWFTPPSKVITTPTGKANLSSDEDNWRTPFTSRKQTRTASSRTNSRHGQERLNRRLLRNAVHDRDHDEDTSMFSRNGRIDNSNIDSDPLSVPVKRRLATTRTKTPPQRTALDKGSTTRGNISRRRRASNEPRPATSSHVRPLANVENITLPPQVRGKKLTRGAIPDATQQSPSSSPPIGTPQTLARNKTPTGNRRNISFIQIPDSDVEVIDCDIDVIDLCSDEEEIASGAPRERSQERLRRVNRTASHRLSPHNSNNTGTLVRNGRDQHQSDQRRLQEASNQRARARSSSVEFVYECDNQSLILSGVLKLNPQTRSLTEDQRRQFNKWLRKARAAEARGPEGYSVAIRLYSKCLGLCDRNDYLTSRILSLSQETRVLSSKDFTHHGSSSRIAKKPHSPQNRRRRPISDSSS